MAMPFQRVSLFLWPRVSLLKQLRPYCRISRTFLEIPSSKLFYSTTSSTASRSYNQERSYGKSGGLEPVLLQTIISTSSPSTTTLDDILNSLARAWGSTQKKLRNGTKPIIVILATPSFTAWLERQFFIRHIIGSLFDPIQIVKDALDVTVVAAVVDALPTSPQDRNKKKTEKSEGLAIMFWERELSSPTLEQIDDGFKADTPDQHQSPKIVFSFADTTNSEVWMDIAVPLANTIFRTGRPSTLLVYEWTSNARPLQHLGKTKWEFTPLEKIRMNSLKIKLEIFPDTISPLVDVPLQILTPRREVAASFGNVIKQVVGADGHIVSASQELEACIDVYIEVRKLHHQAFNIWALILPEHLISGMVKEDYDIKLIRESWDGTVHDPDLNYHAGECISKGAHLHRVLSGGGGWGPKQGLLALDLDSHFAYQTNATNNDYNTSSDDATVEQMEVRALGNIAKPGSHIQFLISPFASSMSPARKFAPNSPLPFGNLGMLQFLFGCVPSTMDDMAKPLTTPTLSSLSKEQNQEFNSVSNRPTNPLQADFREWEIKQITPKTKVSKGFFGARSEAGISIRGTGENSYINSKIDVPYSQVTWSGFMGVK